MCRDLTRLLITPSLTGGEEMIMTKTGNITISFLPNVAASWHMADQRIELFRNSGYVCSVETIIIVMRVIGIRIPVMFDQILYLSFRHNIHPFLFSPMLTSSALRFLHGFWCIKFIDRVIAPEIAPATVWYQQHELSSREDKTGF